DYPNDYPDYPNEAEPDGAAAAAGDFYAGRAPREPPFPGKFPFPREGFGPRGWARERGGFAGFPARGGWAEPRGGSRRLPSLFHNIIPEPPAPFRACPGAFRGLKRMRRGWKVWDAEFRPQRKRLRRDSVGRRRQRPSPGGPGEKTPKTDGSDNSSSDN
ncbi:AKP8L protein, partial [Cettia cetti]|nr:AKP8L protein [Cettia cetti]